jgi:hypothetical protein
MRAAEETRGEESARRAKGARPSRQTRRRSTSRGSAVQLTSLPSPTGEEPLTRTRTMRRKVVAPAKVQSTSHSDDRRGMPSRRDQARTVFYGIWSKHETKTEPCAASAIFVRVLEGLGCRRESCMKEQMVPIRELRTWRYGNVRIRSCELVCSRKSPRTT